MTGMCPRAPCVAQDPASGNLTKGGTVTLTISKGPKLVEVPSFIGKQASEAKEALEKLGFEVQVDEILGGFFGTVRAQDPVDTSRPRRLACHPDRGLTARGSRQTCST